MQHESSTRAPLVSIGVPVFNGERHVGRAIDSLRQQGFADFEVLLCDNGSTDRTRAICEAYVAEDERFKYFGSDMNHGPSWNFQRCLDKARGTYFMWLASDDYLDPQYVGTCIEGLEANADAALASGRVVYQSVGRTATSPPIVAAAQDSPLSRILSYALNVGDNGTFYGVYRRKLVANLGLVRILGGDWLWMFEVAAIGKIVACPQVAVYREDSWATTTPGAYYRKISTVSTSGPISSSFPRTAIAANMAAAIAWRSTAFAVLGAPKRAALAAMVGGILWLRLSILMLKSSLLRLWVLTRSRGAHAGLRK